MFAPSSRIFAPTVAIGLALIIGACGEMKTRDKGDLVPLAELDTDNITPTGIALVGPDRVIATTGNTFDISVEGDPAVTEMLRFKLKGQRITVKREDGDNRGDQIATVRISMPRIEALKLEGSGTLDSAALSGDSIVLMSGSGSIHAANVASSNLRVEFAGSGKLEASGTTENLDLNIVGSGTADLAELEARRATVKIVGSGGTTFASDGKVDAKILGSGDVRVLGDATCTTTKEGSGALTCARIVDASTSF